jgi:superfamily I DNA/RNA helicase
MSTTVAPFANVTFSKYQTAVFDAVKGEGGNILVNAVAGSGKSFTLEHAMKYMPRNARIIALAFNKSIAEELQKRIPDGAMASTLNSVGHRTWGTWGTFMKGARVDGGKVRGIAREVVPFNEREETSTVVSLVQKAKVHGIVTREAAALAKSPVVGLTEDTDENWLKIAERYGIDMPWQYARVLEMARQCLTKSILSTAVIDFDDQLFMPIIYGVNFTKFDWILVDEAQDLSDIQIEMIKRMGGQNSRYLFVGDRRQSLYAFRGADSRAMDRIKAELNCNELPLSVTYRCPRTVVEYARRYEPTIEARDNAPDGEVRFGGHYFDADYQAGDMVICRRSVPVVTLAYTLLGRRIPCRVQGRDIAEGIKALVRKLRARSAADLLVKLANWEQRQIALLVAAEEEEKVEQVTDKANTLRVIVQSSGAETVEQVEQEIEGLFSGDGPCVLLSTVHRAKGLEADRVFVIDHDNTPKYARSEEALEQEKNIKYVAVTRAKSVLVFVSTSADRKEADVNKV